MQSACERPQDGTWSLNLWKTRLLLNYKGVGYRTEWLEYPEIKPRFEGHVQPNAPYTILTVILPDGTYLMDSRTILDKINTLYPSPALPVQNKYFTWLESNYGALMSQLKGIYMLTISRALLNDTSVAYWYTTRELALGMSVDELERREGGDVAWGMAGPLLRKVTG